MKRALAALLLALAANAPALAASDDSLLDRIRAASQMALVGGRTYSVPSRSMEPGIPRGSIIVADPIDPARNRVAPGDIIVFRIRDATGDRIGIDWVKRAIAVGGETVEIRANHVFVDGRELTRTFVEKRTDSDQVQEVCYDEANGARRYRICEAPLNAQVWDIPAYKVPEGQIFVLGDDRGRSVDSRAPDFGVVYEAEVRGIVHDRLDGFARIRIDPE